MLFWMRFWGFCLIAALAAFSVLAVVVTIGGAADILRLLGRLEQQDERHRQ